MRKKTHIALAKDIVQNQMISKDMVCRKSFYLGNILPDCMPSFLIEKHNIEETFDKIKKLAESLQYIDKSSCRFWRKLGCIIHYIADYFTYPHNQCFTGSLLSHCTYEKELKKEFKIFLNENSKKVPNTSLRFSSLSELWSYLKEEHETYMQAKVMTVSVDIRYITDICHTVYMNLVSLCQSSMISH